MTRTVLLLTGFLLCSAAVGVTGDRAGELRRLLRDDCGSCHGMTLKGGLGPALLPAALAGKPDALLAATILHGRPGTPMPPWAGLLTPDEVTWLVRTLRQGMDSHD